MADVMRTVKIPHDIYEWAERVAQEQAERLHRKPSVNSVLVQAMEEGKKQMEQDRREGSQVDEDDLALELLKRMVKAPPEERERLKAIIRQAAKQAEMDALEADLKHPEK